MEVHGQGPVQLFICFGHVNFMVLVLHSQFFFFLGGGGGGGDTGTVKQSKGVSK